MARKLSQSDPALAIEFWLSGFYTHRSQLFAPFKGIGVNVIAFHDPVIDGANFEDTDLYEWQRRPGFSVFCSEPLIDGEIVNQFYSFRNLNGEVIALFDSTLRLASFTDSVITTIITNTTIEQGYPTNVENMVYFSDGAALDMQKWDSAEPFSTINPSAWGLPAPTVTPTIFNLGCWLPSTLFTSNTPILDPNGNVEVALITASGPTSATEGYTAESVIPIAGSYGAPWDADQHPVPDQHYWSSATPEGTYSNYISFQGFGFTIPATATILGVLVSITKEGIADNPASFNTDYSVKLTVAGSPTGTDHANPAHWAQGSGTGAIGTTWATVQYGSSTDLWGLSLTPAIVNAAGFGVAIAAQSPGPGSYPFVNGSPYPTTIQIYYQLPSGPTGSGQSGLTEPIWSTVINSPTQDGTIIWTNVGPIQIWYPATDYLLPVVVLDTNGNLEVATTSTNPIAEWDDGTAYAIGEEVLWGGLYWIAVQGSTGVPPAQGYYVSTTSGSTTTNQPTWVQTTSPVTTGPSAPTWNTTVGGTTQDGDYTWTNIGPGSLVESFGTSYVYGYRTIYGHITTCSPISLNTGAIFGAENVGITAYAITGNVVTFTGTNNFIPGSTFTVNGFDIGTYLNGQTFVVLAAGLTTTSFSAAFMHADVGSTADTAQTTPLIMRVMGVGTGSPLCNATSTITAVEVSADIVTIYTVNQYVPGLYVTFTGVTNATWLNNLQLEIINVDPDGMWIQVYFVTANLPTTPDTGTTTFNAVEIYRVSDGGGIYLFAGAVTNPGANLPWTYYDFTTDADLDILSIAPQNHQNDPPPGAVGSSVNQNVGTITAYWQGRLWMVAGNYVYFDAGPDCTNGIPEESWPPANRFQFAGPPYALIPTPDGVGLLVYLADRVNVILGGPETISFYPTDALGNFGISNPNAVFKERSTIGQFTTQKQYVDIIGSEMPETGEHIADYLTANFAAISTYATMHRDGLDVGIFLSNGSDQVLRYGSNIGAWSVPAFPIGGAGALRSIETSVGTYSLMLASPTGGNSTNIPAKNPGIGASAGVGAAWVNPGNITAGNPTSYATVTLTAQAAQTLSASNYAFNIPSGVIVQGVKVSITGKGPAASDVEENAGTGADVPVSSGTAWTNPNNIAITSQSATLDLGTASVSDLLQGSNFGFAIPADSKILGIEVAITGQAGATTAVDTTQTSSPSVSVSWNSIAIGFDSSSTPSLISQPNSGGSHGTQNSSASSFAIPTSVSTAGDLLIVSVTYAGTSITPGISDTFRNVWTKCLDFSGGGIRQVVWSAIANASTGAETITPTSGSNVTFAAGGVFEVANMTGTFSATATGSGTGPNPTAGNLITITPNTFALGIASSYPTYINTFNVGSGWTQPAIELRANDGTSYLQLSWEYQTVAGSSTDATFTIAPNQFLANTASFTLTESSSTQTIGNSTDLWGGTWTPALINSSAFGFSIQTTTTDTSANVSITNPMTVTVYYVPTLTVTPLNAAGGAESDTFVLGTTNTTVTFGGFSDLWGMPWVAPAAVNSSSFGFGIDVPGTQTGEFYISEVQVTVYYGGSYLLARDTNSWGDLGQYGENNGSPYSDCYITVGSITLSQPGALMFPLQHVVGYFDAAGTLGEGGGASKPNIWILPNEVSDTQGIGFVYLPEVLQEPPEGQNHPSKSLLALRWPVNMMNSQLASQFIHHLQVKIEFEPENAPNTIKAIAFKEDQS